MLFLNFEEYPKSNHSLYSVDNVINLTDPGLDCCHWPAESRGHVLRTCLDIQIISR